MERASDFVTDLKRHPMSAQLRAHLEDVARRFPADENGVPRIPHLDAERTQQYLQRCVRTDAAMQDAAARGADVAARNIAQSQAGGLAEDWQALRTLPQNLVAIAMPEMPPADNGPAMKTYNEMLAGVRRQAGKLYADIGNGADQRTGAYERSMAGPTDVQRRRVGNDAMAAFHEPSARDSRVTFGMSQLLSAREQRGYLELDDRFKAVERVNRYLDYGRANDRTSERAELSQVHADTLAQIPEQLDVFYASSRFGTLADGFRQKAQVGHELSFVDGALTAIQQRDGIANDGSFKLPLLSQEQSKEWLERCERADAAGAQAGLARMTAIPKALESIEKSGLAPEQQRERVEQLIAESRRVDSTVGQPAADLAAPKKSFTKRLSAAWKNVRGSVRSLSPFQSSRPKAVAAPDIAPTSGEQVRSLDAASYKATHSAGLEGVVAARAVARIPKQPSAAAPVSHDERIVVSSGEVGHEAAKSAGFTAMGFVEGVKHFGDAVEIDYAVHGHHFDVKIDGKGAAGHALAHAADELKAGDSFKMSIAHDRDGRDVASLDDRTTGESMTVDKGGHIEKTDHAADLSKSRQSAIGR